MPEIITTDDALYAFDIVKRICEEVGLGSPDEEPRGHKTPVTEKIMEDIRP